MRDREKIPVAKSFINYISGPFLECISLGRDQFPVDQISHKVYFILSFTFMHISYKL